MRLYGLPTLGRTLAGYMVGDPVAEKKTISIKWGYYGIIVSIDKKYFGSGYFPFSFHDDGIDVTLQSYRGTLSKEQLARII